MSGERDEYQVEPSGYAAELSSRLRAVCAELSYSEIARRTGTNRETTRRYLTQGKPTAEFVARLCQALGVSATWLLLGRGPRFDGRVGLGTVHTRFAGPGTVDGHALRLRRRRGAPT